MRAWISLMNSLNRMLMNSSLGSPAAERSPVMWLFLLVSGLPRLVRHDDRAFADLHICITA